MMRRAASAPEHHRASCDIFSHGCKPVGNQHRESMDVRRNHRRDPMGQTVDADWSTAVSAIIGDLAIRHGLTPVAFFVAAWTPAARCSKAQASCALPFCRYRAARCSEAQPSCAKPCCRYGIHPVSGHSYSIQARAATPSGAANGSSTAIFFPDGARHIGTLRRRRMLVGSMVETEASTPSAVSPMSRRTSAIGGMRHHRSFG